MHQQINLYQPIFREPRKLISLSTVAWGFALIAVALVAMWGIGFYNVKKLETSIAQLKQQQAAQERMAQAANALFDARGNAAELQAVVQILSSKLAERSKALEVLRSGVAGEPRGFASRLEALAHRHTEGVWLDELLLGGGPNGLVLRGRCVDADLVPKYLQQLTLEPELSGTRFDDVVIDRRKDHEKTPSVATEKNHNSPTLRFSVSSARALRMIEAPET